MSDGFAMLTPKEIASSDPFGGHGIKVDRPAGIPDGKWTTDFVQLVLKGISSGEFSVALYPTCLWLAWDNTGKPPEALSRWLIRHIRETDIPLPAPEDIYQRLREGETLSLEQVSDVLRDLAARVQEST